MVIGRPQPSAGILHYAAAPQAFVALLALLMAFAPEMVAAELSARASRNPVGINDSFQLIFESADTANGDPDFSPLEKDFEIVHRGQSQSIQIINGEMTRKTTWQLTVMAKRAGELRVPAIRFGKQLSPELYISVRDVPASSNGDNAELFVELEVSQGPVYVQGQLVCTVRLFVADALGDVRLRRLGNPKPEGVETVIERLGDDQQYKTRRATGTFTVLERRYALFPQRSGTLRIPPILFEGEITKRPTSPFGMFDIPFGGSTGDLRRVRSKELSVNVLPIPSTAAADPWLPASSVQLAENWSKDPGDLEVGEPVTWTLAIIADGLTAAQLPALADRLELPEGVKTYPDQPVMRDQVTDSGITGSRQEKLAVLPSEPGTFVIPPLKLTWWNTATGKQETVELPGQAMTVSGAATSSTRPTPSAPLSPAPLAAEPEPRQQAEASPIDGLTPSAALGSEAAIWRWATLICAAGWLMTLILWWGKGRRHSVSKSASGKASLDRPDNPDYALSSLRQALSGNEPTEIRKALLKWGQACWPSTPPRGLTELSARLPEEARGEVLALDRSIYGGADESEWSGAKLMEQLERCRAAVHPRRPERPGPIAPLNP